MSRARENADGARLDAPLASPAFTGTPTGITAAHLEAGVLPSDVTGGSGLTALGTVTAGVLEDTVTYRNINQDLASTDSPTFAGIGDVSKVGASCRASLTANHNNWSGHGYLTGYTSLYNGDSSMYSVGTNGITITTAGVYAVTLIIYASSPSSSAYMQMFLAKDAGSFDETQLYSIDTFDDTWNGMYPSTVEYLSTGAYGLYLNSSGGTINVSGGTSALTTGITLTYLRA
jgi:hypothetical protein